MSFVNKVTKGSTEYDIQDARIQEIATTVEENNTNPVTSDGVYAALQNIPGGGGVTVPTFTPTSFEIELPDVDISLSSQDCADIIQNQYPIITISYSVSEETIALNFAKNNSLSGMEKGEPYTNLQYDLVVDDDEDAYIIGLSFSDNDMKSWCMKITSDGGDKLVPIEVSLVPHTNVETIAMTSAWDSEGDFYQIAVSSRPSAIPDKVVVNYNNGESVEIPKTGAAPGGDAYIYGDMSQMGEPDFTTYPFCVGISIEQGFTSIVAPNDDATDVSIDAYITVEGEYDVQMPSGVTKTTILEDIANGKVPVLHVSFPEGNDSFWCYSTEVVSGEISFIGESDGKRVSVVSDSSDWDITFVQPENTVYDFDEADIADQSKLAEFYNLCPMTLRVHTVHDGLQMYRLQNDYRTEDNQIIYSCLLFGSLVEMTLTESSGTYSIGVVRYALTPANNN